MKHIVGLSGGIDSQACARWCIEQFGPDSVILVNSDAGGNEHPLTTEHLNWYHTNVHSVVFLSPIISDLGDVGTRDGATGERRREFGETDPLSFDRLAYVKGRFPSRKAQFCTEYLKLAPQKRWLQENLDGLLSNGYARYTGVRADESNDRAKLPPQQWDDYFDCELYRPLLSWTKEQCFDYCKSFGERINPLYSLGFSRVGCAPCINSSKEDIREWAARFPAMIDKVRAWEQSVGRTFFRPMIPDRMHRKALKAWVRDWVVKDGSKAKRVVREGAPPPPEPKLNWIDDVVRWSRTSRGGGSNSPCPSWNWTRRATPASASTDFANRTYGPVTRDGTIQPILFGLERHEPAEGMQ